MIDHIIISLFIIGRIPILSNDNTLCSIMNNRLQPLPIYRIPFQIMPFKRQGYDQLNVSISSLLLQAEDFFRRPHIHSQCAANIEAPNGFFIM